MSDENIIGYIDDSDNIIGYINDDENIYGENFLGIGSPVADIDVDPVPIEGSTNAVSSGGVYDALEEKMNLGVLLTNEDLNDILTPGLYYAAGGNSVGNKPTGYGAFGLFTFRNAGSYVVQQFTATNTPPDEFIRMFNGASWSSWTKRNYTGGGGGADLPETTALLKGNGTGGAVAAIAGTDFVAPEAGKGLFSGAYSDLSGKPAIPSTLAALTDDANHRLVTDAEKNIWQAKSEVGVNILHNGEWGAALINQRRHSGAVNNATCLDRWCGVGTVTPVEGSHVTLTAGTVIAQGMEILPATLTGRDCTFALLIGGAYHTAQISFPASTGAAANTATLADVGTVELGFAAEENSLCGVVSAYTPYLKLTAASDINVARVWLEYGNVCHAAMVPAPEYSVCLLVCQRYALLYGKAANTNIGYGLCSNTSYNDNCVVNVLIAAPCKLRIERPTVSHGGTIYLTTFGNNKFVPKSFGTCAQYGGNTIYLTVNLTKSVIANGVMSAFRFEGSDASAGWILFDADIAIDLVA